MKKLKLRPLFIFLISAVVFLAIAIPFRDLLKISEITEIRPAAVLNPVLGVCFGLPAIIGCTIGNFVLDFCLSKTPFWQCLIFLIPQFLYGFVPYWVWKKRNAKDKRPAALNDLPRILRFLHAITAGSFVFAVCVGVELTCMGVGLKFGWETALFVFINNTVMNAFLGIPLMIILSELKSKIKHSRCEKHLLYAFLAEAVTVAGIIIVRIQFNHGLSYTEANFWFITYAYVLIGLLVVMSVSIVLIALDLQSELKEKEYDLKIASSIQQGMLPRKFPHREDACVDIFAYMKTAKEVGGDFYDYFRVGEDTACFVVADVSGKGVPASLFMMRAASTIRGFAKLGLSVEQVLEEANKSLQDNNKDCYFVTAWLGSLDLRTGLVTYANAGHNYPMLRKADGETVMIKEKSDTMLGIMPNVKYTPRQFEISPGDMLYIYTDGVPEANNSTGDMFKEERMIQTIAKAENNPEALCNAIITDVESFCQGTEQFDDITMLAIKYEEKKV